jgi:hypothetical protein
MSGHPPEHGAWMLATHLERNRLEPRVRRMLAKLQRELAAMPWETLRALVHGRLARRELVCQQREAALLANPDTEGGKWLLGLWAAQRRDIELLALLDRIRAEEATPTLADYLQRATSTATAAPAPAAPVAEAEPVPATTDVVTGSGGSEEPTP